MKGREWYQKEDTAEEYDDWRFSKGGALIDEGEKEAVFDLLGDVQAAESGSADSDSLEDLSVLEIACGTGRFTVELARRDADVVGMDISKPMMEKGVKKAKQAGVYDSVDFLRGDAGELPFPDDSFDVVIAMRFFHLADTPIDFLSEMRRVSRSKVLFDTFMEGSARVIYNRFLPMGSRLYSEDEVKSLLGDAGLSLEETKNDFFFPFGLYRITPTKIAEGIRDVDDTILDISDDFSTVSYWLTSTSTSTESDK